MRTIGLHLHLLGATPAGLTAGAILAIAAGIVYIVAALIVFGLFVMAKNMSIAFTSFCVVYYCCANITKRLEMRVMCHCSSHILPFCYVRWSATFCKFIFARVFLVLILLLCPAVRRKHLLHFTKIYFCCVEHGGFVFHLCHLFVIFDPGLNNAHLSF